MAFFAAENGVLARTLWPAGFMVLDAGGGIVEGLEEWQVLPPGYDDLCARISIHGASSRTPRVFLTDPQLEEAGEYKDTTLRLQGIVTDANLKTLGNWSESEAHAPKAVQFLALAGGGVGPAFGLQRDGLLHLEEMVMNTLGEDFVGDLGRNGGINMRRRVFSRVHPSDDIRRVRLSRREDPGGRATRLNQQWAVDHRIKVGVLGPDGRMAIADPVSIRRGDFVDVAAKIQVVRIVGRYNRRTEVMLCPVEVVRLQCASDINALTNTAVGVGEVGPAITIASVQSGLGFPASQDDVQAEELEGMEDIL